MAVGLNAKMPAASPEAVTGLLGGKGAEGEGFAQMLTGVVTVPALGQSAAGPADKLTTGDTVAQMLDISAVAAAAAMSSAVPASSVVPASAAATVVAGTVASVVGPEAVEGLDGLIPGRRAPVRSDSDLPHCMVDIGDLSAKILHLERALGIAKDAKAAEDGDDEGDAESDTVETPTTPEPAPSPVVAAPPPASAAIAVPVAAATAAPAVVQTLVPNGSPAPKSIAAKLPAKPQPAIQSEPVKGEPAAKAEALLKALEPVKPFKLPLPELRQLAQASLTPVKAGQLATDGAQAVLAAFARPDGESADAPAAAPVVAPSIASPLFGASIQALVQPQLAADALAVTEAPVADGVATPDNARLGIDRQLDIARDNQWLDRLARDISQSAGKEGSLKFRLNPETLGSLHVEIAQSHAGTSVRLTADTEAARNIIADAQPRLIAEARAQGVRIAEAHVGLNSNGDQRRQENSPQQAFVRTAATAEVEPEQSRQSGTVAVERFA